MQYFICQHEIITFKSNNYRKHDALTSISDNLDLIITSALSCLIKDVISARIYEIFGCNIQFVYLPCLTSLNSTEFSQNFSKNSLFRGVHGRSLPVGVDQPLYCIMHISQRIKEVENRFFPPRNSIVLLK